MLWPFLLAPFAWLPGFVFVPLVLNAACCVLYALVVLRVVERAGARDFGALLALTIVLGTNAIGLVFTGLEHSLQLLLAALLAEAMLELAHEGRAPRVLWFAVIVGPLVRYESAGLSMAALVLAWTLGKRRAASFALLAMLLPLGLFSLALHAGGLDPLPASVLAKSSLLGDHQGFSASAQRAITTLWGALTQQPRGLVLALLGALLCTLGGLAPTRSQRALAGAPICAVGLHLVFGRYGWYHRYELYLYAFLVLLSLALLLRNAPWALAHREARAALLVALLVLGAPYIGVLFSTPLAARNVFLQHVQMRRIVDSYGGPVAVNDLGVAAFQNPHYVLDFGGLASPAARRAQQREADGRWMERMAAEHGVELALIYDSWFGALIPGSWRKLAELRLEAPCFTPASDAVSVYARSERAAAKLRTRLRTMTFPAGAALMLHEAAARPIAPARPDVCASP